MKGILVDEMDYRIIRELRENGRRSYKEIAKKLKVSDGTIRLRTERLIQQGFVGIKTVVNPFKFEHRICSLVGINLGRRGHAEKMEQISKLQGVVSVVNVTGRYDLMVELFVESKKDLMEFLVNEISKIDGIQVTETFIYLDGTNKWITMP